ncbi:MAG: tetratricopeptide repeat protein [Proteobacteria bacterium]|nr:tetratricopeptide repeat protein [Pseudomonadota bacterium]
MLGGAIFVSQAATIQEARTQFHAGKTKPALKEANTLLQTNPENIAALFLKAQIQSETQQIDQAIETYRRLISIDTNHLQAYNNLAALYAQQGKLVLASETLEQAIRTDPVYTTIHTNLRAIYMDMSKKHYRQALKLAPEGNTTQIASIDLGTGTDQILSEEIQVVPQSIQAAINTTVASKTVVAKASPIINEPPKAVKKVPEPAKIVEKTPEPPKAVKKAPEPAKIVEKIPEPPKAVKKAPEPVKIVEKAPEPPKKIVVASAPAKTTDKPKTVAVAKPRPVAEPKPKPKPEPAPKIDPAHEVKKSLLSWANAWSNRDVKRYVNAYVNSYSTAGKTRKEWAAGRRWNFKNKKYIKVSLSDIHIKKDDKRYQASFKQRYESNSYQDVVNKEIIFVRQGGHWKIARESTK